MLEAARKAAAYVQDMTWSGFIDDELRQNAVAYQVQIIGEAAAQVSADFRQAHSEIPWAMVIGMRHRIVHNYRELRRDVLWSTAKYDAPELIKMLAPLIPPLPEEMD